MRCHAVLDGDWAKFEALLRQYPIHPLHVEDCQHGNQNAKIEDEQDYSFIVLKPLWIDEQEELQVGDLDIVLRSDALLLYEETPCPVVKRVIAQAEARNDAQTAMGFYRIFDGLVDSYLPVLDQYSTWIDELEEQVLARPEPDMLERIFATKRGLNQLRRVLTQSRDVALHLLHCEGRSCMPPELRPYFRDVYDHLVREIEHTEMLRDLLSGSLDIYLTSVANRTNETMKVLTLLSTLALPAVVISGFFGMNFKAFPALDQPHGVLLALLGMGGVTAVILVLLRRLRAI